MILYEFAAGFPPFEGKNFNLMSNIINSPYKKLPENVSEEIKDLIDLMLKKDPILRPSIKEVLNHKAISPVIESIISYGQEIKE